MAREWLARRGGSSGCVPVAHAGLNAVIEAMLLGASWQRCRVHFLRKVLALIPKGHGEMVAAAIRTTSPSPTRSMSVTSST